MASDPPPPLNHLQAVLQMLCEIGKGSARDSLGGVTNKTRGRSNRHQGFTMIFDIGEKYDDKRENIRHQRSR